MANAARTCYKSTSTGIDSDKKLLSNILLRGHESVLEHEHISMLWVCDRGVSHELVRHRIASYSQESTRYVKYRDLGVVNPLLENPSIAYTIWLNSMQRCEQDYFDILDLGFAPQIARSVLPNSLKTEVAVTMNYRSLRNMLRLRCAPDAHPQFRQLAIPLLLSLRGTLPILFEDIQYDTHFNQDQYATIELETTDL